MAATSEKRDDRPAGPPSAGSCFFCTMLASAHRTFRQSTATLKLTGPPGGGHVTSGTSRHQVSLCAWINCLLQSIFDPQRQGFDYHKGLPYIFCLTALISVLTSAKSSGLTMGLRADAHWEDQPTSTLHVLPRSRGQRCSQMQDFAEQRD